MNRIKEKAPVTPASATSAENQSHVYCSHAEDTTDRDKMQERYCASNYLEYCKLQGKEPNSDTVWLLGQDIKKEPSRKTYREREAEAVLRISQMDQRQLAIMIDLLKFMVFVDEQKENKG